MSQSVFTMGDPEAGRPLVEVLAACLGCSRKRAKSILDRRLVFVNRRRIWMAHHLLRAGDRLEVVDRPESPIPGPLPLLREDETFLVVDKPAGLQVQGRGGIEERLRRQLGEPEITAVHRLDRDTTGCLILARSPGHQEGLLAQFRDRTMRKTYRAIVQGRVTDADRTLRKSIEGKTAVTHLRVLKAASEASYLSIRLETGRTHQIRRHLASIRHPVLGDPAYGEGRRKEGIFRQVPRPLLHAYAVRFAHPSLHREVAVRSPLPADFRTWLHRLGLG